MKKQKCYKCDSYFYPPHKNYYGGCGYCEQKLARERAFERSAAAAKDAEETDLPKLEGSAKQIAWAHDVRKAAMADFATFPTSEFDADQRDAWDGFAKIDRASWWIENRVNLRLGNMKRFIADAQTKAVA